MLSKRNYKIGKAEVLQEGNEVTILAIGKTVATVMEVAKELDQNEAKMNQMATDRIKAKEIDENLKQEIVEHINRKKENRVEVINARFLKPFDKETIIKSLQKTKHIITIEDGTIINGLGTAVKELIVEEKIQGVEVQSFAYPDEFIPHGSVEELERKYKMDKSFLLEGYINKRLEIVFKKEKK